MEKECQLYEIVEKKKKLIKCLACAHKCLIGDGKTGICGVRKNINGKLILLVYGKMAAVHVDPIEKKPLYDFLPGTKTFSIGSVGCNMKCLGCQNWDISQISKEQHGRKIIGESITSEAIVKMAFGSGCKSIAYTYNEPIIFVEFIKDVAVLAHKKGLKNIMVTNGYWSEESFEFIRELIDAVNIDLKGDDKFYEKYCGGRLQPVLDTIKRCSENGIHVEVTTLVIPGLNDNLDWLEDIARFLGSVDRKIIWHLSRFFPMYKMLNGKVTPVSILERAKEIGENYLERVYVGNV